MAKSRKFAWQPSLLNTSIVTCASTRRDGGETSRIKYEDHGLFWRCGNEWQRLATVEGNLFDDIANFTDMERDLISSVLLDLGYKPGNPNNL